MVEEKNVQQESRRPKHIAATLETIEVKLDIDPGEATGDYPFKCWLSAR